MAYRTFSVGDFQIFVGGWDDDEHPVFYALIRNPGEWDAVFHPAPTMGGSNKFGFEEKVYDEEQILVVSRVMFGPDKEQWDKVFRVEEVNTNGEELVLRYRFEKPKQNTYTVKWYFGVLIPKRDYKQVVFIENGIHIGALNVSEGQ